MIKVKRFLTKDFYPTMVEWWKGNDFQIVSPSMLPEFTFVSYNNEGTPTYSMCFYNTDSNLAWIGWQLKNPIVEKENRIGNLKCLFQHVEQYAKTLGYHILFTTSNTKPVENIMQGLGYGIGDVNVKHYLKQL
jgi:hypothetical protein